MKVIAENYKILWQKCKSIGQVKFIHAFWVSSGSLKLKIAANDRGCTIKHNNDLEELFPVKELFLDIISALVLLCLS